MARNFKPESVHLALDRSFFTPVKPAQFPKHIVRFRNEPWSERIGLGTLSDDDWINHFGKFEPLPGSLEAPLALAYHGHQFQTYNPELGDGRGFLFAQLREPGSHRLLDLGTKGSGQTPWSRGADGRLTLKGAVREILATEYLEALGVNTSKTFCVIETGEELTRGDEPSPTRSAVLTRLSHSNIRIGTFQRLAALELKDEIEQLLSHCVTHYFTDLNVNLPLSHRIVQFLEKIVADTAETTADWMAAGFVHGVLNTDNINITGESFDYGPWRFLPTADPGFTAAYFDQTGLYAYARQPEAIFWNICRLAECFTGFLALADLEAVVTNFGAIYSSHLNRAFARRLGLEESEAQALDLRDKLLPALTEAGVPFEDFFFNHYGGKQGRRALPVTSEKLNTLSKAIKECAPSATARPDHPYFRGERPQTLLINEVEELWSHIERNDNWGPLHNKVEAIRQLGTIYQKP